MSQQYRKLIVLVVSGVLLSACSGTRPPHIGLQHDGRLAPCPDSPNCVSSFAPADDPRHAIAPIPADDDAWQRLPAVLTDMPRIRVTRQEENYLAAEATSLIWRFVDDLEFLYDREHARIHVRSASRVGHSDFGVNRKRVERVRKLLNSK